MVLKPFTDAKRRRAVEIAARLLEKANALCGACRDQVDEALRTVELAPAERRLAEGLMKLIEDASEFEQPAGVEPAALRSDLFVRATEARRRATLDAPFSREQVLAEAGAPNGLSAAAVEEALYSDLRGAQRLVKAPAFGPEALVFAYERAEVQAVLLRAVEVVARVQCRSPEAYRVLFQKLKFRQLLYRLEERAEGGYSITIDGPFSLFEAVTKYGLELALSLPALEACDVLDLSAVVLWGKTRTRLRFEYHHVSAAGRGAAEVWVRNEVQTLLDEFGTLGSAFDARIAEKVLDLPGVGLCVPDLVFQRRGGGAPIYLELLGYWSREAVFRRLELARAGLEAPVLFAASSRLRVSEAVLDDDEPPTLYVFRGKPSARAVERKLEALSARFSR